MGGDNSLTWAPKFRPRGARDPLSIWCLAVVVRPTQTAVGTGHLLPREGFPTGPDAVCGCCYQGPHRAQHLVHGQVHCRHPQVQTHLSRFRPTKDTRGADGPDSHAGSAAISYGSETMAGVSVSLANYDGGLKERPKRQRSGTFTITASHYWVLHVGGRQNRCPINGGLDRWTVHPTATGHQSCRVIVTSKLDATIHFAFELLDTSAEALTSELAEHIDHVQTTEHRQAEIQQLSDAEIIAALKTITFKLQRTLFDDREGRLAAWQEEVPLRRELVRRHPVVIPPDILKATLSPYHLFCCYGRDYAKPARVEVPKDAEGRSQFHSFYAKSQHTRG